MCAHQRTKYSYTDSNSPWNRKFLLSIFFVQTVFTTIVVALGVGFWPSKENDHRGDDGWSNLWYFFCQAMILGVSLTCLGFLVLQIIWYRNNTLHPKWFLVMNVWSAMSWLALMIMAGIFTNWGRVEIWEVIQLLDIIAGFPWIVSLIYTSIVYHRFRKTRKAGYDIEIQSLDSRKPLT